MSRPALPKPKIGHIYKPDWLNAEGMVISVSKMGAVQVQFDNGRVCWYRPGTFREHFAHIQTCFVCDHSPTPPVYMVMGEHITPKTRGFSEYIKDK